MQTKKWYESKTIWLNLVSTVLAVLGIIDANVLHLLGVSNPASFLGVLGVITTILNIILRSGNVKPISNKPSGTFLPPNTTT